MPDSPTTPAPAPRIPIGVVRGGRAGRRRVEIIAYEGAIGLVPSGRRSRWSDDELLRMTPGQITSHGAGEVLEGSRIDEIDVWEWPLGGEVNVWMVGGEHRVLAWSRRRAKGADVEVLLGRALPGKVDLAPAEPARLVRRVLKSVLRVALVLLVVAGGFVGARDLLKSEPPPPPPPPPPPALPAEEQTIRAELGQACPPWQHFSSAHRVGDRPDPAVLRPLVNDIRPRFDAVAALDPELVRARDQVAWLQDFSARTVEEAAKESSARIDFAIRLVTTACAPRG